MHNALFFLTKNKLVSQCIGIEEYFLFPLWKNGFKEQKYMVFVKHISLYFHLNVNEAVSLRKPASAEKHQEQWAFQIEIPS